MLRNLPGITFEVIWESPRPQRRARKPKAAELHHARSRQRLSRIGVTYYMELRSTTGTYMASVSWQYPQDQLIALHRQNLQAEAAKPVATDVDLAKINFRYAIEGDRAPWRPLRAYDDGRKVFIEFPRGIAQGEMPPLFVVGPEGDTSELVNYRVRGNYLIIDRLFAAAELRFGADKHQKRVRIVRTDGRPAL